jgi:integrase
MATIKRRLTAAGEPRWQVRWRDPAGEQQAKNFPRRGDAEDYLASLGHALRQGTYVDPAAGRITFRTYAERWRAGKLNHRPNTRDSVAGVLQTRIYPTFGDRPLSAVRRSDVQGWVAGLATRYAPATVRQTYAYLVGVYRAAVRDRLVGYSPCEDIDLPRIERELVRPLTVDQVHRLAEAVPARYRALVVFAAGAGLRPGEAFGVTVDRLDFLRREVTVDRQLASKNGDVRFGPPKTRTSNRVVPVPRQSVDAVAGHLAAYPASAAGLIFTDDHGRALSLKRVYGGQGKPGWWRKALSAAELPSNTTLHDLRHFYASLLIAHGADVKAIQSRLGHASATETLDTYGHLWPDSDDRTRRLLEAALEPLEESSAHRQQSDNRASDA